MFRIEWIYIWVSVLPAVLRRTLEGPRTAIAWAKGKTEDSVSRQMKCMVFVGPSAPTGASLQTAQNPEERSYISRFCEMKYLLKKDNHKTKMENALKERNEIFLTVYSLPTYIFITTLRKPK